MASQHPRSDARKLAARINREYLAAREAERAERAFVDYLASIGLELVSDAAMATAEKHEREARFAELAKSGWTNSALAAEFEITKVAASRWRSRLRIPFIAPLPEHGTLARYESQNCRCPECKAAYAEKKRVQRNKRHLDTQKFGLPKHVTHGASAYSNWGCRCDICSADHSEKMRRGAERQARKAQGLAYVEEVVSSAPKLSPKQIEIVRGAFGGRQIT